MKSSAPEELQANDVFQIQFPISGVNFSNNIPILQITWHNLWNLLTLFRMGKAKKALLPPPTSFSLVTFANVGIRTKKLSDL